METNLEQEECEKEEDENPRKWIKEERWWTKNATNERKKEDPKRKNAANIQRKEDDD